MPVAEQPPPLTPRQKEVLDLLVKGRTNAQIADELGVSLPGAKWHVSEVISRLGVGSREEAADYWRVPPTSLWWPSRERSALRSPTS